MCRCVLAFMYGAGCITVAALSSFLDWGVLQVGSSLHHITFLLMFKVSVGHGLRSGTQKAFLWTPIQVYQNAVLTYSHKPWTENNEGFVQCHIVPILLLLRGPSQSWEWSVAHFLGLSSWGCLFPLVTGRWVGQDAVCTTGTFGKREKISCSCNKSYRGVHPWFYFNA